MKTAPPPCEGSEAGATEKKRWFARLRDGLARSSSALSNNISAIFSKRKLDDDALQDLEDILIKADMGIESSLSIVNTLRGRHDKNITPDDVLDILATEVEQRLDPVARDLDLDSRGHKPHIILMVGVNGSGKTTTIGKLAAKFRAEGKKILIIAGDTFRAAAIDQLRIWAERSNVDIVARDAGADAAGVVFDGIARARADGHDIVLIDTAGRLHNKQNLMDELDKIIRVIRKQDDSAPHDILLTLDATTGQNAIRQVDAFKDVAGVTGLIMTKLDGTARGGVLVAIAARHGLPVHAIGMGEKIDDLRPFTARAFASAIIGRDY